MKKLFSAMMVLSLAMVLVLGGCSGGKKGEAGKDGKAAGKDGAAAEKAAAPANPYAELEADFCNPEKAADVLMNDTVVTFIVKMTVQMMKTMMPPGQEMPKEMADMMNEEKLFADMKKQMETEKPKDKPDFVSCEAKVTAKSCDEIYKEIGDMMGKQDPNVQKALGDPAKFFSGVATELKIKDCGVMNVKFEDKKEKKKIDANVYVGDVNGKKSVFFYDINSMK